MKQFDLGQLEKTLELQEFDTSFSDGILAGSREYSGYFVEITIDSGGACLVKKTTIGKQSSKSILLLNQKILKISFSSKISQVRVKLNSENNLLEILKSISTPLF